MANSVLIESNFSFLEKNLSQVVANYAKQIAYPVFELQDITKEQIDIIGRFRTHIWKQETKLSPELIEKDIWTDKFDTEASHWIVLDKINLIGTARLTVSKLRDAPDGYIWEEADRRLPEPVADLTRLVVSENQRRQGIGKTLHLLRIEKAIASGAKSIIVSASFKNKDLLISLGFVDTGIKDSCPDRPEMEFFPLEYICKI